MSDPELTILTDKQKVKLLRKALVLAEAHLSYCGYGDQWERSAATAQNLEKKITQALEKTE